MIDAQFDENTDQPVIHYARSDTKPYIKRTSLALDERLLEEAVEAMSARTKKEAVEAGLKALIRMKQKEMLRKDLGTFDYSMAYAFLSWRTKVIVADFAYICK